MTPPLTSFLVSLGALATLPFTVAGQAIAPCASTRFGARAECGTIPVAERPDAKQGRTIDITFTVLRAETSGGEEPVFLLAGGPGQGSTDLAGLATGPFSAARARRDFVLVDQRGTGGSNPLACKRDVTTNPRLAFGHVFDPEFFAQCRATLERRADLGLYTTDLAVRDLDAVRARLGYERVILWGGSYGTRLAQAYMRRFPERVAAAVLDGVVPFDFGAPSTYARTAKGSLDRVFADCAAQVACRTAYPNLRADFDTIVHRLRAGSAKAKVGGPDRAVEVTMSMGDFAYAVRGILYGSRGIRQLPGRIHRAAESNDLGEFAEAYWRRAAGFQDSFADGLHLSIFCGEDIPFVSDRDARRLAKGTFFEAYLWDEYAGACRTWKRAAIAGDFRTPLESEIPTLLLSGAYDPVTPPETAERVARSLTRSRHLVIPNEAHGAGFGCARPAVLHVLRTGSIDGLPDVCAGAGAIDFAPEP